MYRLSKADKILKPPPLLSNIVKAEPRENRVAAPLKSIYLRSKCIDYPRRIKSLSRPRF